MIARDTIRFNRVFLSCFCVVLLLIISVAGHVGAQEKPRLKDFGSSLKKDATRKPNQAQKIDSDDDVVRVQTDLVVCDVLVVDRQGKTILGLRRDDFIVREDDQLQKTGTFSIGDDSNLARSIVLILDYSYSQLPYIKTSVEAAKLLVDELGPNDHMALVTDDVKLLVDFTRDKGLLKKKLQSLKNKALSGNVGKSLQYSALMATLNELFTNEDLRPIVIFQTDGDELRRLKDGLVPQTNFSLKDLFVTVEKSRATIYSIIPSASLLDLSPNERAEKLRKAVGNNDAPPDPAWLGFSERRYREQLAIASVAKLSGGWPDFLEKPEQADDVYSRIFADINNRYIIGYYPGNKAHDGQRRKIKIEVRGHPEYVVWGRKTYLAPKD